MLTNIQKKIARSLLIDPGPGSIVSIQDIVNLTGEHPSVPDIEALLKHVLTARYRTAKAELGKNYWDTVGRDLSAKWFKVTNDLARISRARLEIRAN